jgi:hypothetical protein
MKKNFLALVLAITLVLGLAVPAMAQSGNIGGTGGVDSPTLSVIVPMNLNFALDPLAANEDGTQVTQNNFLFINNTDDAKVLVALYLELILEDGIDLVDVGTLSDNFNIDAEDKELAFGIIAVEAATLGEVSGATVVTEADYGVVIEWFEEVTAASPGDLEGLFAEIGFVMDAKDGDKENYAVFSFHGVLNAYAGWAVNDVKVTGVYLLRALSTQTVVTIESGTMNMFDGTLPPRPEGGDGNNGGNGGGFTPPQTDGTILPGAAGVNDNFTAPSLTPAAGGVFYTLLLEGMDGGTAPLNFVRFNGVDRAAADWEYDSATGVFTAKWLPGAALSGSELWIQGVDPENPSINRNFRVNIIRPAS